MRQEGERSALRSALWPKGYTYSTCARESHLYTVAHLRLDRPSSAAHNRKSDPNKTRIPARAAGSPRYTVTRHAHGSLQNLRRTGFEPPDFERCDTLPLPSWLAAYKFSCSQLSCTSRDG